MVLGVGAMCIVSSVNVDRMIARENVDRYLNEGKELDMEYIILSLSVDTVPEVKRAFDAGYIFPFVQEYTKENFHHIYFDDSTELKKKRSRIWGRDYTSFSDIKQSWKEFNFSIEKLKNL